MFRKFYMTIQSLARKREILSWLFPFTESLTYMVANCGEQNLHFDFILEMKRSG